MNYFITASAVNGNVFNLAEIHRLRGEILLAHSSDLITDAEACFNKSLEIARAQQAKSSELRTTVSLCRLHMQQGRSDALANLCLWFQEGRDLPDLIEATQLLNALT